MKKKNLSTKDEIINLYLSLKPEKYIKHKKVKEEAAKNEDYKIDATGATDAYLRMKEKLGQE